MRIVSAPAQSTLDLIDLKFLPDWVKEEERRYSDFEGEEGRAAGEQVQGQRTPRRLRARDRDRTRANKPQRETRSRDRREPDDRAPQSRPWPERREKVAPPQLPALEIRFLPQPAALENVVAQIQASTAAYSVYALARLFLQKPERYHVRVNAKGEKPMFRLADSSVLSMDRDALKNEAFRIMKDRYYKTEVAFNAPVKGNFASIARERSTGTLLGPTNHHVYQSRLRRLYEQRFSRRMGFADFQRQIEIVSDPALVERWKEEARRVTTFTTIGEELPQTFAFESEAERHFREKYLPTLIGETREAEIDGVTSRNLPDRGIARVIENAWAADVRSPSNMMQELTGRLRGAGLQIFRHRKGMLYVSPIRPKPIEAKAASDSVRPILETLESSPRISRKELAEKLIGVDSGDAEKVKLSLASDLHWLIREGHIIEFSDGSLDLPRTKAPPPQEKTGESGAHIVIPPQQADVSEESDVPREAPAALPADASISPVQNDGIATPESLVTAPLS